MKEEKAEIDLDAALVRHSELYDQLADGTTEESKEFASPGIRYCGHLAGVHGVG